MTRMIPTSGSALPSVNDFADTAGSSDYFGEHDMLSFAPGETTRTVTVHAKGDAKVESRTNR